MVKNAVELARALAASDETSACFATHWLNFAYGRTLDDSHPADRCTQQRLIEQFKSSGYNIKQLLLDLTQTDSFLYLPSN